MKKTFDHEVRRLASLIFRGLGTPLSLSLEKALVDRNWSYIAQASADPVDYSDAFSFGKDALACSLLKKYPHLPVKVDRRKAAVDTWWDAERKCYGTNERLYRYLPGHGCSTDRDERVMTLLGCIRKEVELLIGPCPPSLVDGKFGPGATFTDRGGATTVAHKMSNPQPTLTTGALWFLPQFLGTLWGKNFASTENELAFIKGNRFTTVPKTALTDRAIAIEPSINIFYQLGLGGAIRRRLRNRGWDLDKAADIHRQLACDASKSGAFCTLDLSSASDTVAKVLVELLLPPRWFSVLDDLRSKFTLIDGRWVLLEKFSSMGNGYTFELETVIFSAISCAVTKSYGYEGRLGKDVFVFGDDIIVPSGVYEGLRHVLAGLGFTVNEKKSFSAEVPFKESCGGDFFHGCPVRGFYLKNSLNFPSEKIAAFNGLRRSLMNLYPTGSCLPPELKDALLGLRRSVPGWVQACRGPEALGDIVFHDIPERWTVQVAHGIRYVRVFRPARFRKVKLETFDENVQLATLLVATGSSRGLVPRGDPLGYKCDWVPFS